MMGTESSHTTGSDLLQETVVLAHQRGLQSIMPIVQEASHGMSCRVRFRSRVGFWG